jgi:hypothetical protein
MTEYEQLINEYVSRENFNVEQPGAHLSQEEGDRLLILFNQQYPGKYLYSAILRLMGEDMRKQFELNRGIDECTRIN